MTLTAGRRLLAPPTHHLVTASVDDVRDVAAPSTTAADVVAWCVESRGRPPQWCDDVLASEDRVRAARFRNARARDRFVVRRAVVQWVVSVHAGRPAGSIAFDRVCRFCGGTHGKPHVVGAPWLHVSASESEGRVVCAVSSSGEIGADVTAVGGEVDNAGVMETCFSPRERSVVERRGARSEEAFARAWARKEAVVKLSGHGLSVDMTAIETASPRPWRTAREVTGAAGARCLVWDVDPFPGFVAALAVEPTEPDGLAQTVGAASTSSPSPITF